MTSKATHRHTQHMKIRRKGVTRNNYTLKKGFDFTGLLSDLVKTSQRGWYLFIKALHNRVFVASWISSFQIINLTIAESRNIMIHNKHSGLGWKDQKKSGFTQLDFLWGRSGQMLVTCARKTTTKLNSIQLQLNKTALIFLLFKTDDEQLLDDNGLTVAN